MATLTYKTGRAIIQPIIDGRRRTVSVARVSRKTAETIRGHVDHLVAARETATAVPQATAQWLREIGAALHMKLTRVGLVATRNAAMANEVEAPPPVPLAVFLDAYITRRTDVKRGTRTVFQQARRQLVEYFGAERDLRTINRSETKDWVRHLQTTLATATIATHIKKSRIFFGDAVEQGLIPESPMKGIKAGSQANAAGQHYVPAADVAKVIEACPNIDWKLRFALARYAGLRTTSETNALEWAGALWDQRRMVVHSPKTEHLEGHETRVVPIVPELMLLLEQAFAQAPEGARYVIQNRTGINTRTMGVKIINRSGVTLWPKLFQNLRLSRQTDWAADHPGHVVCAWMGNSEAVAKKHYLVVTERDFDAATAQGAAPASPAALANEKNGRSLPAGVTRPSCRGIA